MGKVERALCQVDMALAGKFIGAGGTCRDVCEMEAFSAF